MGEIVRGIPEVSRLQGNPWFDRGAVAVKIDPMATTVLIVDDHPTFRRLARRLIEDAGFTVVGEAVDGESALAAVRELRPDAVLLDVLLPDRSGIEVAGLMAAGEGCPAVVLTSSRSARDLGAALDGAPARFIAKSDLTGAALAGILRPG